MKPTYLTYDQLPALKAQHSELVVHDHIDLAIDELFDIAYPAKKDTKTAEEVEQYRQTLIGDDPATWGQWVYYPWLNQVVHFPDVEHLRALRTSRNRNLITSQEQTTLYTATVLVIGMSVGSNVVEALVSQGIGGKLILVDMDSLEPSNLNRIRSPYHHVGLHKVEAISRKVWEIDPYIEIIAYRDGLDEQNLTDILEQHNVSVIVDEMDELRMKIILREQARQHHIAVVMAADDGDDALLDIERYDLHHETELFNGRIPSDILDKIRSQKLPRPLLGMMIGKYFVGSQNIPLRMYESLGEVGKSLPSWPQLGGAAALSGISIAYTVKKILLGLQIKDGRSLLSLDEKLDMEHADPVYKEKLSHYQAMLDSQDL